MSKLNLVFKKVSNILKLIFGYGILICLFVGGLTFLGYVIALIIGGNVGANICTFIYKGLYPYLVKISSIMVVLGLIKMYLCGETALSSKKK